MKAFLSLLSPDNHLYNYAGFISHFIVRNDVTRLALDTLAVLTVSVKSQLELIEPISLPTGVTDIGIRFENV